VLLIVAAAAKDVPSSVGADDQFAFSEISGDIVLTSADSTLRVPYLLVPRRQHGARDDERPVVQRQAEGRRRHQEADAAQPRRRPAGRCRRLHVGPVRPAGRRKTLADTGYDIRAVGVQSFPTATTR
jgi:hypothetical protein